jgi:hypothetical protein
MAQLHWMPQNHCHRRRTGDERTWCARLVVPQEAVTRGLTSWGQSCLCQNTVELPIVTALVRLIRTICGTVKAAGQEQEHRPCP